MKLSKAFWGGGVAEGPSRLGLGVLRIYGLLCLVAQLLGTSGAPATELLVSGQPVGSVGFSGRSAHLVAS